MDFRVCWTCKGLVSFSKWTSDQMDNHMRLCSGEEMLSTVETSKFDYFVCDKTDFFPLSEIKRSLNKDLCTRLQNRDKTLETDVPNNVIESLLKLSISKIAEVPKLDTEFTSPGRNSSGIPLASSGRISSGIPLASSGRNSSGVPLASSGRISSGIPLASSGRNSAGVPLASPGRDSSGIPLASSGRNSSGISHGVNDQRSESWMQKYCSSQTDSCISSCSPPLVAVCDEESSLNILTEEEETKISKECNIVKKGNFEMLICKLCSHQSKSSKLMLRHLNSHDNGKAFHCKYCKFSTTMRSKWNLHQCKLYGGNLLCHVCSERFTSQSSLDYHLTAFHSEKVSAQASKHFQCDQCNYLGRDQASLIEHQRKHTGESLTCPHDNCEFKTLYKRSLQKHLQQKHSKEKTKICEVCGFQTRHSSSLAKHIKLHKDPKQYKCAECSFSSHAPSDVMLHIQRKHLKQKKHSCPKCPFQSGYLLAMKKHMARHETMEADGAKGLKSTKTRNLKYYSCSVCGDVLNNMKQAKQHILKFHSTEKFEIVSDSNSSKTLEKEDKDVSQSEPNTNSSFSEKNMNFDSLLDVDITSDVLDMANNILSSEVSRKDGYTSNNVDMAIPDDPMCQSMFHEGDTKSSVSRKRGNPMLSATTDVLTDMDSSLLIEDSLFDLMSDLPRPPTLNRCQSASSLMFASFTQHMVDRPLTPDFFTDIPTQSFFQNFSSRSIDQDNFSVNSLNPSFQMSSGFPSQIDLTASQTSTNKPTFPVLSNFTCFPPHPASQGALNLPSTEDTETSMTECLL